MMLIRCKAGSTRPISDLDGVGRRVGEMEEDPASLQVGPHLSAGLHALVLKLQLLHPNLTYNWVVFRIGKSCGSMKFWYRSGSGSGFCYFRQWLSWRQQKKSFFFYFFGLLLFERTYTSFSKDKKSKNSRVFFLLFFLDDGRIRIRIWLLDPDADPGGPKP